MTEPLPQHHDFYVWEKPAPRRADHAEEIIARGLIADGGPQPKFARMVGQLIARFPLHGDDTAWACQPDANTTRQVMHLQIHARHADAFRALLDTTTARGSGLHYYDAVRGTGRQSGGEEEIRRDIDAYHDRPVAPPRLSPEARAHRLPLLQQRQARANQPLPLPAIAGPQPRPHHELAARYLAQVLQERNHEWFWMLAFRQAESTLKATWELLGQMLPRDQRLPAEGLYSYYAQGAGASALVLELPPPQAVGEFFLLAVVANEFTPNGQVHAVQLQRRQGYLKPVHCRLKRGAGAWDDLGLFAPSVLPLVERMFSLELGQAANQVEVQWASEPLAPTLL